MTKILMIEDRDDYSYPVKRFFEYEGYGFDIAKTKDKAIEMIKKKDYDVVMLDLELSGKKGFETFEAINELDKNINIVVISGFGEEEEIKRAKKLGAKGFIVKSRAGESDNILYTTKNIVDKAIKE